MESSQGGSSSAGAADGRGLSTYYDNDTNSDGLVLPPECWSNIMEYLPFESILSCSAVSRTMLHDAVPRLTVLRIDQSRQINLKIAARFRDIREIHINSLLKYSIENEGMGDDEYADISQVDFNTKIRVLPFLSRFDSLQRVFFGGELTSGGPLNEGFVLANCYFWDGDDVYPNEGSKERMMAFLDLLSGAFDCGALPDNLQISGLCCPDLCEGSFARNSCQVCRRACMSFPLESVLCFENDQSSFDRARSRRPYGLDVCLDKATIESIIESRPGGHNLLRSEKRLLHLLGGGHRYGFGGTSGTLNIVKYKKHQLDEMKRVVKYAELDTKKLSMQKVSDAIMSSFAIGPRDQIPQTNQHYLSETSIVSLRDEVGIDLSTCKENFASNLTELVQYAKHIKAALNKMCTERTYINGEYSDVILDFVKLIRQFLEIEVDPPIDQIADVIPSLEDCLQSHRHHEDVTIEAAASLKNILARGTHEHKQMVIDAGSIESLGRLLRSRNLSVTKAALLALSEFVKSGATKESIDALTKVGGIRHLTRLLCSEEKLCVESSLDVLVAAIEEGVEETKDLFIEASSKCKHQGVLSVLQVGDEVKITSHGLTLLRTILDEADKDDIQAVIDSKLVPTLIQVFKSNRGQLIQSNLAHIMVDLTTGTCDQTLALIKEEGFLHILVGFVDSADMSLVESAMSAVDKIARKNPEHLHLITQTGVPKSLLKMLGNPGKIGTLRLASSFFSTICDQWNANFDETKTGLEIIGRLLVNSSRQCEVVVRNTCQLLFQLLKKLTCEEVERITNIGFVEALMGQLSVGSFGVKTFALKSIYIVVTAGEACAKLAGSKNGIAYLKKTLSVQNADIQNQACSIISNIIAGNQGNIQVAIDGKVVPCLVQMLASERTNKTALRCIYQISTCGTNEQVKQLVSRDSIYYLCSLLVADSDTAVISVRTIKKILEVGKENVKQNNTGLPRPISPNAQFVEGKLEELTNEILRLENESGQLQQLGKKKAWLDYEAQDQRANSLNKVYAILMEKQEQSQQTLNSFGNEMSNCGSDTLLRLIRPLYDKENQSKADIEREACTVQDELKKTMEVVAKLYKKAQEIAPISIKGEESLDHLDIPVTLEQVNQTMRDITSTINVIESRRVGEGRMNDIDSMMDGLRRLFNIKHGSVKVKKKNTATKTKKKRKVIYDSVEWPNKKTQQAFSKAVGNDAKEEKDGVIDLTGDNDNVPCDTE